MLLILNYGGNRKLKGIGKGYFLLKYLHGLGHHVWEMTGATAAGGVPRRRDTQKTNDTRDHLTVPNDVVIAEEAALLIVAGIREDAGQRESTNTETLVKLCPTMLKCKCWPYHPQSPNLQW